MIGWQIRQPMKLGILLLFGVLTAQLTRTGTVQAAVASRHTDTLDGQNASAMAQTAPLFSVLLKPGPADKAQHVRCEGPAWKRSSRAPSGVRSF